MCYDLSDEARQEQFGQVCVAGESALSVGWLAARTCSSTLVACLVAQNSERPGACLWPRATASLSNMSVSPSSEMNLGDCSFRCCWKIDHMVTLCVNDEDVPEVQTFRDICNISLTTENANEL
jgi:hypothetical protein